MRILADENCPGDLVEAIQAQGVDVIWIRLDAPGSSDPDILARAQSEERVILTFDKDFGELAFRYRLPATSGVILCRLHGLPPARIHAIVLGALQAHADWVGHFVVITEQRMRVVPLPAAG